MSPKRSLIGLASTALVTFALVAACAGGDSAETTQAETTQAEAGETTEVTEQTTETTAEPEETTTTSPPPASIRVGMHWISPEASWSGLYTADALGFYEEENLEVELVLLQGSAIAVQQVGAGEVDIGLAGSDTILGGLAEGLPLIVVANHLQNTPTGVIYPSDASVSSFADLDGMSISTSAVGPEAPTLISRLQQAGVDPDADVELVYVDPQAKCSVMLTGDTDACTGFNNFQLLQVRQEDPDAGFLSFSTEDAPLLGHSIFANQAYAQENGDVIARFLRATMRGYIEAEMDDEAAADHLLAADPEGSREFLLSALEVNESLLYSERTEENGWGWMEDEPWENLQSLLLEGDVITAETPVDQIYTNEYLPEDRAFSPPS